MASYDENMAEIRARARKNRQRAGQKAQSGASRKSAGPGPRASKPAGTRAKAVELPASLQALTRSRVLAPRTQAPTAAASTTPRVTPTTTPRPSPTLPPRGRTGMAPGTNAPALTAPPVQVARPVAGTPNTGRVGAGQTSVTGRIPPENPPAQVARPSGQRLAATTRLGTNAPQVKTPLKPLTSGLPSLTRPSDPGAARLPLSNQPAKYKPAGAAQGTRMAELARQGEKMGVGKIQPLAPRPAATVAGDAAGDRLARPTATGTPPATPRKAIDVPMPRPKGAAGAASNRPIAARTYGTGPGGTQTQTTINEDRSRDTRAMTEAEVGRANLGKERNAPQFEQAPTSLARTNVPASTAKRANAAYAASPETAAAPAPAKKKSFGESGNLFDWLAQ
jgi:hypothetical protein